MATLDSSRALFSVIPPISRVSLSPPSPPLLFFTTSIPHSLSFFSPSFISILVGLFLYVFQQKPMHISPMTLNDHNQKNFWKKETKLMILMIVLIMMMMRLWIKLVNSMSVRSRKKQSMLFESILALSHVNWASMSRDFIIWDGEVSGKVINEAWSRRWKGRRLAMVEDYLQLYSAILEFSKVRGIHFWRCHFSVSLSL